MAWLLVDGLPLLGNLTGIGRYTFEVARRIREDETFRTYFYYGYISSRLHNREEAQGVTRGLSGVRDRVTSLGMPRRVLRRLLQEASRFDPRRFDIYWTPNMDLMPRLCEKSRFSVLTLHDFSWLLYPQWHPAERVTHLHNVFLPGVERAAKIITGSRFIRDQGVELCDIDPSRIEVIYHGVDHTLFRPYPREELEAFRQHRGLPQKFLFFAGTLEPRKNLVRLLEAFASLPSKLRSEYALVLGGAKGWKDEAILQSLERMRSSVYSLGYLPYRDLAFLYNLADLFVFPSLYEGFGIPPLEAMACGTPVLVGNNSSLPEVCGDAGAYVDAEDAASMARVLEELLEDPAKRNEMSRRGIAQAKKFSWEESARRHGEFFAALLER